MRLHRSDNRIESQAPITSIVQICHSLGKTSDMQIEKWMMDELWPFFDQVIAIAMTQQEAQIEIKNV